jgi:hypothetical protein
LFALLLHSDSNLPSPYKSIDEVEMEADVAAAEAAAAAADAGGCMWYRCAVSRTGFFVGFEGLLTSSISS